MIHNVSENLARGGVKIPRPPGPTKHDGGVSAFIEDPDGHGIEPIERMAETLSRETR